MLSANVGVDINLPIFEVQVFGSSLQGKIEISSVFVDEKNSRTLEFQINEGGA